MYGRILFLYNEEFACPGNINCLRREGYEVEDITTKEDYYRKVNSGLYSGVVMINLRIAGEGVNSSASWNLGLETAKDAAERGLPVLVCSPEAPDINRQAERLGARVLKAPAIYKEMLAEIKQLEIR